MSDGSDIRYFFMAYTAAFVIFLVYTIYLAARLGNIERKVETLGRRDRAEQSGR
jgi:CcmD family protein